MMTRRAAELEVFIGPNHCGVLTQAKTGALNFRYDSNYSGVPLSLSMPVGLSDYGDRTVRPYLMGLLPDEESTRAAIGAKYGVSGDNPFKLLAHIGNDCPGAVRVVPKDELGKASEGCCALTAVTDSDIAELLANLRENASAAWTGQGSISGHWSLGGCQAKVALCQLNGRWFRCEGSWPSTHILKPGVVGMKSQALVEYISMRLAASIGLPTASVSFNRFDDEWAIVIERYDRMRNEGVIERIHQEDLCQALGVSPLRKYAEQGGPNTPQIIALLKDTGHHGKNNVYRFVLYLFFNYLIGATDAHAKNHSLVLPHAGDIRLAPLYDVASIAPYESLSPKRRKPLRAALSIGGENRFGCVTGKHIEKMVQNCGLDEVGLDSDLLKRQFKMMAEMIPPAARAEVDHAVNAGFPRADEVGEPMEREITENCRRALAGLE